jgi:hypothetical protein
VIVLSDASQLMEYENILVRVFRLAAGKYIHHLRIDGTDMLDES